MSTSLTAAPEIVRGPFLTAWVYDHHVEFRGKTFHVWTCKHREGYDAYALTRQPPAGSRVDFVKPTGTGHFTSAAAVIRHFTEWPANSPTPSPIVPSAPGAPLAGPLALTTHGVKITVPSHLVATALQDHEVKTTLNRWGAGSHGTVSAIEAFLCLALTSYLFPLYQSAFGKNQCREYATDLKAAVESHQEGTPLPVDRMTLKMLRFLVLYPREIRGYPHLLATRGITGRPGEGEVSQPELLSRCRAEIERLESAGVVTG